MPEIILKHPWWLAAVLLLPLVIWLRWRRRLPALMVPYSAAWWRPSLVPASRLPALFFSAGLIALAGALSRPQTMEIVSEVTQEGYDIMLAIDLSGSMLA